MTVTMPVVPAAKIKVRMEIVNKSFLYDLLKKFPGRVAKRVQKTGMRAAGRILATRLKSITPRGKKNTNPFHIQDHYGMKQVTYRKSNTFTTIVGLTKGHGYLAHLLEHGTADRRTHSKSGNKTVGYKWVWIGGKKGQGPRRRIQRRVVRSTGSVHQGGGKFVGKMDANKYYGRLLQKAMDSTKSQQQAAINQSIQDSVVRQLKRMGSDSE